MKNVDAYDFLSLGVAPLFHTEALLVDTFVDRYGVGGWLPGEVPLE